MSAPKANPVNVTPAPSAAPVRPVIAGPNDDELQLVTAARAGDIPAFETLVNRYERKIFRLGMNITGSREDAEDVMQEAFLKAYQHLPELRGIRAFIPGWCALP